MKYYKTKIDNTHTNDTFYLYLIISNTLCGRYNIMVKLMYTIIFYFINVITSILYMYSIHIILGQVEFDSCSYYNV